MSHYDWLERNFNLFVECLNPDIKGITGLIVAHGDKCYSHKDFWKEAGIPFEHGVAMYLLSYLRPWSKEVRETDTGWVDPFDWVIKSYPRYKEILEKLK